MAYFCPIFTDPSIPIYFCEVQFQDDQKSEFLWPFSSLKSSYISVKLLLTMIGVGRSFIPIVG
jgi:hypothetical protein